MMRSFVVLLLSTCTLALGLDQAGQPGNTPAAAKARTSPEIDVKRTEPVEVVYLEHVGTYWSLGPRFMQLREYMVEHEQSGPMYARFFEDPTGAAPGSVHSEIGFIVDGDHEAAPPFVKARREAELVAYMIAGPTGSLTRSYTNMREWIESHGYVALGPVTEIYPPLKRGVVRQQRTEIQMPLRFAAPPVEVSQAPVQKASEPTQRETAGGELEDVIASEPAPESKEALITTREESTTQPRLDELEKVEHEVSKPEPVEHQPLVPVKDLIAARQFDLIAEQLLPGSDAIPQTLRLWLGQLVFRIGAATKGIKQMYPSDSRDVTELGDAVTRRYKSVSAGFQLDPLAQAVVTVDTRSDPLAAEKRAIMRDMDALLGGIALRSVDVEEAMRQLADIVQRTQDLVRSAQPMHGSYGVLNGVKMYSSGAPRSYRDRNLL
jgi:effector-binding domain-containing protein